MIFSTFSHSIQGTVLCLQKTFGFLRPDNSIIVGNIYFNAVEIRANVQIKSGDRVDFYLIKNKKTEKFYAIDIDKLEESANPNSTDRKMLSFIKHNHEQNGPKVIAIRQPKAPDGTKGFSNYSTTNGNQ